MASPAKNRAKTHCPQGHAYAGENLYVTGSGGRACRACKKAQRVIRAEREREEDPKRKYKWPLVTIQKYE